MTTTDERMQLLKEGLQQRLDAHWPLTRLCNALEHSINQQQSKLTFSAITQYNRCPFSYYMRYVEHRIPSDTGINKDGDIDARAFGSMVHAGLALHWEGFSPDALFKSFEPVTVRERCAVAMVGRYAETYPNDLEQYAVEAIEAQFDTERYKGQVDGIIIDKATGERMLLEHKTALVINDEAFATYRDKLAMDLQIRLYCHAVGVNKVLYDVLKKPYIRRRKAETDDEFVQRYAEGCTFTRFVIDLTADDIADAMADADAVYTAVAAGRFCKSRNNCNMGIKCDYFDLCAGKKTIDDYTLKDADCELVGEFLPAQED